MKKTLSPRLQAIAELIADAQTVADVGCHTARLPVYLAQNNPHLHIEAIDISHHSIQVATKRIATLSLHDINLHQGNGLEALERDVYDVVIIAGLGTKLIIDILNTAKQPLIQSFIIASTNRDHIYPLRKWVQNHHFYVQKEIIVKDKKYFYEIIKISKLKGIKLKQPAQLWLGVNYQTADPLFLLKWKQRRSYLQKLLASQASTNPNSLFKQELNIINNHLFDSKNDF